MTPDKTLPAWIFVPSLDDYVEIVGGKCELIDGKRYLRIVCADSQGNEVLLNPSDLQIYFERCAISF
ncbi:hypothetical protein Nos7524_5659 (plasmid) [Nostoc sp. PCC 7524]|uniref:hypothetical protein n=1 Tax=Nostoc sp. (strain ATCC 29411 / PCC 7524) TaxID=28072 RepID=UPI00029EF254|nr:hypothetical protein [Nostoc sp. PCC 7524]AFY51349.1 hypothetical protein Nos7524_5659 [Nostoc sp. PCC 7524]